MLVQPPPSLFDNMRSLVSVGLATGSAGLWRPEAANAPQCMAYRMAEAGHVMELGYGGQAGGGKTDLLLGLASTIFSRSRIMRREFPQLDGIVTRGNEIYPVSFVAGTKKAWDFGGRLIALRSMQYEKDWKKYQGQSLDFLGIDEAAEFPEAGVRALTGWLRNAKGKRTLVVYTFNPPTTPEGEWIIRYFAPWLDPMYANPAASGEIRWMAHLPQEGATEKIVEVQSGDPFEHNGATVYPISRTFIRATRRDNPYMGEEYERRLQALPEPLRTIVMQGDFTASTIDDLWQIIPTNWVLAAQERWRTTEQPKLPLRAIGNDVAHGGADNHVIARLYGNWFAENLIYPGSVTPDGETGAKYVKDAWDGQAVIGVDAVGYGASAADVMTSWRMNPIPINFGAGSEEFDKSGKFKFFNTRAAAYFNLAYALDPQSGEDLCLPPSRSLRADLCAPRYKIVSGKIQVEPKEEVKKRLNRSPDEGDAVVLAWYVTTHRGISENELLQWRENEHTIEQMDADMIEYMKASGMDVSKYIKGDKK